MEEKNSQKKTERYLHQGKCSVSPTKTNLLQDRSGQAIAAAEGPFLPGVTRKNRVHRVIVRSHADPPLRHYAVPVGPIASQSILPRADAPGIGTGCGSGPDGQAAVLPPSSRRRSTASRLGRIPRRVESGSASQRDRQALVDSLVGGGLAGPSCLDMRSQGDSRDRKEPTTLLRR